MDLTSPNVTFRKGCKQSPILSNVFFGGNFDLSISGADPGVNFLLRKSTLYYLRLCPESFG